VKNIFENKGNRSISQKIMLILTAMVLLIAVLLGASSIVKNRTQIISMKSEEAQRIAKLVACSVDKGKLKQLSNSETETSYYPEIKKILSDAKEASGLKFLYVMVPLEDKKQIKYIAEGQAKKDNPDDIYSFNTVKDYSFFFSDDNEIKAFEKAYGSGQMFNKGLHREAELGYLLTVFTPILDENGKSIGIIGTDLSADDVIAEANQLLFLLVIISIAGIIAVCFVSNLMIRKIIIKPLDKIVQAADQLTLGNVHVNVEVGSKDEIGRLEESFQKMIENIREQADAAERIARGDLSIEIKAKSDKDILSKSLRDVICELGKLLTEIGTLTNSALTGDLKSRGNAEAFSGGYREIIEEMNSTLDALITPLKMSADYMYRISRGDIPPVIMEEYHGDFEGIKNNINVCIKAVNELVADMDSLSMAAVKGNLSVKADPGKHSGDFGKVVEGVNATLDAVVGPLRVTADYISRIGRGEIPDKITRSYSGDFEIIKNNVNACIDGLAGLAEGREVLARMSRNDYTGSIQGEYLGIYKEISDSINTVGSGINHMIRILSNVAEGNLSDLQELRSTGKLSEHDRLLPGMATMIENIQNLVNETGILSRAAVEGELSVRGDGRKFNGQYRLVIEGVNNTLDAMNAPVEEALAVLKEMEKGNLQIGLNGNYNGDHAELKKALNGTISNLRGYITEISFVLAEMAGGNLDINIMENYKGDFVEIKNSLNNITGSLNQVLGEIREGAEQVNAGARQVSDGSQALSQGSTEQASAIEELTASIAEIAAQTRRNALRAIEANELAASAKVHAVKGDEHMTEMLSSMEQIDASSSNISKVIKVIDDIAFQTNILALNAAVEAARAGQHGKGFAVVAEEVRNLAARSSAAASETTELIEGSIGKVRNGMRIANETADALKEIVESVEKAAGLVKDIADASNEQAGGVAQVNKGIEQVSQVVQSNSATAEQSAAASEELSGQSEMLKEMVDKFQLNQQGKPIPLLGKGEYNKY
jgi:methyl-accepting chemotaxis protein